jgi:hypothetical protein
MFINYKNKVMNKVKFSICLIFLLLGYLSPKAQEICCTPSPAPPAWLFNPQLRSAQSSSGTYYLNVFVHIVRSSNGSGLSSGIAAGMISQLNSDFADADIQFQLAGTGYINNDAYHDTLVDTEFDALFSTNPHTDAIDIYVLDTATNAPGAGLAQSIPSSAYFVQGLSYNTSTLSHEMGHCLGLYHTHHGTAEVGNDPYACPELVNGTNSFTCGDYISDTPADPNRWRENTCQYIGTSTDANNQTYSPIPAKRHLCNLERHP